MDFKNVNNSRIEFWNKTMLNSYWLLFFFYLIGEVVFLVLRTKYYPELPTDEYIWKHIIIPDTLLLFPIIITQYYYRTNKKYKEEMIFLCSILLANVVFFTINPVISGGEVILILPLMVSIFYTNTKMMSFSFFICVGTFVCGYIFSPIRQENMSIFEFFLFALILIGYFIAGFGVVRRGQDLQKNIEELIKSEEKLIIERTILEKLSKTDALTGLNNHITFHEYADDVIEQCESIETPLQMALMDIDNFKKINDTYGHRAGDNVLKKIGQIIHDQITPNDFAARYGGEEFALIFTGKSLHEVYIIVENIRKKIENMRFLVEDTTWIITISIGLHYHKPGEGKEVLFRMADQYLYLAKHSGKNRTCVDETEKDNFV